MTVLNVSDAAQLASALAMASAGDTIRLAAGAYGDVVISGASFGAGIVISSADAADPASFNTLRIAGSSGIAFVGVNVDFKPDASTVSFSSAVLIDGSQGISFSGGHMQGGPAVNGVAQTAAFGDSTGNVLGLPTGRAMTIQNSSDVSVQGVDISFFDRGLVLSNNSGLTVAHNEIHDLRRSGIVGISSNLIIEDNHLHSSHPWRWGLSNGDHADFIALWSDKAAVENVVIRNNLLEQGDGVAILGLWVAGASAAPYRNVTIEGNAILGSDHQGIMLTTVIGGVVSNNTLVKVPGGTEAPGILIRDDVSNVDVFGNFAAFVQDKFSATSTNTLHDNMLVQNGNVTGAGFTPDSLLAALTDMVDPAAIRSAVVSGLSVSPMPAIPVTGPPAPVTPALTVGGEHVFTGNSSANVLTGDAGNDTLDGRGGLDTLSGGAGDDTYILPNALSTLIEQPGEGADSVIVKGDYTLGANLENLTVSTEAGNGWSATGNELNNVITGNSGANRLSGMDGSDTLAGGAGNDVMLGGAGADSFVGGAGADVLTGGAGADWFRLAQGSAVDRVTDFSMGDGDCVVISDGAAYTATQVGADTVVDLGNGDQIVLVGVKLATLAEGWIQTDVSVVVAPAPDVAPVVPVLPAPSDLSAGLGSDPFFLNLSNLDFGGGWIWP